MFLEANIWLFFLFCWFEIAKRDYEKMEEQIKVTMVKDYLKNQVLTIDEKESIT